MLGKNRRQQDQQRSSVGSRSEAKRKWREKAEDKHWGLCGHFHAYTRLWTPRHRKGSFGQHASERRIGGDFGMMTRGFLGLGVHLICRNDPRELMSFDASFLPIGPGAALVASPSCQCQSFQDPLAYDCAPQMTARAFTGMWYFSSHRSTNAVSAPAHQATALTIASPVTTIPLESDPVSLESGQPGRCLAPFHARWKVPTARTT